MKFLHLGDLHLGKTLGEFSLLDDQRFLLDEVLKVAEEKNVDGLLLAGDIYDRSIPAEGAVKLFNDFLEQLEKRSLPAYIISGNHDSAERLHFGSQLFEKNHIYIAAKYDGTLRKYTVEDEFGTLNIYLLPFVKASSVKQYYPEVDIKTYDDAVRVILEKAQIDEDERNLLVAHQFVAGNGTDIALAGSEGLAVQQVGLIDQIGYDCFDAFDYVALGHIHGAQKVGREEVRYSGSLMKYSLKEAYAEKSCPLITFGEKGKLEIEQIPLKPKRNLRHIKGQMKKLLAKENVSDTNDFIYVTLTDEEIIDDVMSIFQKTYPNTIKIAYENSHTKDLENLELDIKAEEQSFSSLIHEFYEFVYGCEMSEEEEKVMEDVAREAGVLE